jgi:hypothetical protein
MKGTEGNTPHLPADDFSPRSNNKADSTSPPAEPASPIKVEKQKVARSTSTPDFNYKQSLDLEPAEKVRI